MEEFDKDLIEALLPGYFSGTLGREDKKLVDDWKNSSIENASLFDEYLRLWKSMGLLREMEAVNAGKALVSVNSKIRSERFSSHRLIATLSRIAAILFIPLLCYSLYFSLSDNYRAGAQKADIAWQTMSTGGGMRGNIQLPDGSHVMLNSGSEIKYPTRFTKGIREIRLKGEAYFEVTKDPRHPFVVNTGKMNVEVLGTIFNVSAYDNEAPAEVVLKSGSVKLFSGSLNNKSDLVMLKPGQRAVYDKESNKVSVSNVETDKYLAWKDGNIIFRDDSMSDVVTRLERWFNVDIYVVDDEILDYEITAKFHDETLAQVLNLLRLSSGIEYTVEKNSQLNNGEFTRTKIYLRKK